jgi:hypothetical protein
MNDYKALLALPVAFLVLFVSLSATAGDGGPANPGNRAVYLLRSSVMGAAGLSGTSTSFGGKGTLGQPTGIGTGTSTNFVLYAGFWTGDEIGTGVSEEVHPTAFRNALLPNAPNPFNPLTSIRYEVGTTAPVRLAIYNIHGQVVRRLVDGPRSPGCYTAVWDGRADTGESVASGVYLCRLQVGSFGDAKKMVLAK